MDGVCLDDVRRALQTRDPMLPDLVVALTNASDPSEPSVRDGVLTFSRFMSELKSWGFKYKSDDEKYHYRVEGWKALEASEAEVALPDRLWLHTIVRELWESDDAYARESLLQIIARVPLKWGPWRAIKAIFKEAEASGDMEVFGAIAARLDSTMSSYYYGWEVTGATVMYLVRRAWRTLRRQGEAFPASYADAAVELLRHYPESTNWGRTWIANHIMYHNSGRYGQSSFRFWSPPSNMLKDRAFPEAWMRSPRPLFSLLERAQAERVRQFAIEALKQDFRTVLREVEASWVGRLTQVESAATHDFVVWLLQNVPKFEASSFRQMGLHEPVLHLLDSPSYDARRYAASYARTHARDLPLEDLLRLANNELQEIRQLAFALLGERDPKTQVGLDAWGRLLGTRYAHDVAEKALRDFFGASELTPAWFRERLLSDQSQVFNFAKAHLPRIHALKSLGVAYFTDLFDDERLQQQAATFAIEALLKHFSVDAAPAEFWRRALLHPQSKNLIRKLLSEDKIKARLFGAGMWRALAYHVSWEADAWVLALTGEQGPQWARGLRFDDNLAHFAREILGDVRQFSPEEVGFDWLMELVDRLESHYHQFAVRYMLKAFVPADFAPSEEEAAPAAEAASGGTIDLGGKSFLFTGKLATMTRSDAEAQVTQAGGTNAKSVTASLDYLVVGDEGSPLFGNGKKGSKLVKAEKLIDGGSALIIISETAFLQMLAGGERSFDSDSVTAGCEVLWEMATGPGDADVPRREFAISYLRHHHEDIGYEMTERKLDPGAEIPKEFLSFERVRPLFEDGRKPLRKLGLELARWEFARWEPSMDALVELVELPFADVTRFVEEALLAKEAKETARYRLGRDKLTVEGVYRFCESRDRDARRLGMALISRYADLAIPHELFRLTESPDRQLRAFVIRTIWALYRDRGTTASWTPAPIPERLKKVKVGGATREHEAGPGPTPTPEQWPAEHAELRDFMRRILYGIPPAKLSSDERGGEEAAQQQEQQAQPRRVRPVSARVAKRALVEVVRDLAIEDAAFAAIVAPVLREFMDSRGISERDACLVALTRIRHHHPEVAATL